MRPGDYIAERYRLDAVLGEGGFGVVWTAWDEQVGRPVAIKFLKAGDDEMRRRFAREVQVLARLSHPNCARVYEYGSTAAHEPYIVMEHMAGRPLSELRGTRLPVEQVLDIAIQLTDVLAYAHGEGVVHRDLKPENILLVENGERLIVNVLDFGIAKIAAPQLPDITKTGALLGTPHYMSPEQLRGSRDVGPKTDQYALGVILFELLEGHLPFSGKDLLAIGISHLTVPPPTISRADCPPHLTRVVARLLEKDPRMRFPDESALLRQLDGRKSPSGDNARAVATRHPAVAVILFGAVVATAVIWGLVVFGDDDAAPTRQIAARQSEPAIVTPRPVNEPDVPSVVDDVEVGEAPLFSEAGCGRRVRERGLVRPLDLHSLEQRPLLRYIPSGYDGSRPYPVMLLLHGGNENSDEFLRGSGLPEMAEKHGFLIIAPHDLARFNFEDTIVPAVLDQMQQEANELCIDPRRIYVVGHSHGANAAERLACEAWVGGIAISSYGRNAGDEKVCDTPHPVPTIAVWPLLSDTHPPGGGDPKKCREKQPPIESLDRMEQWWLSRQGCSPHEGRTQAYTDGSCEVRECEVPFVSCRANGGLRWPGTPPRQAPPASPGLQAFFDRCDGPSSRFPSARLVAEFFATLDPQ